MDKGIRRYVKSKIYDVTLTLSCPRGINLIFLKFVLRKGYLIVLIYKKNGNRFSKWVQLKKGHNYNRYLKIYDIKIQDKEVFKFQLR